MRFQSFTGQTTDGHINRLTPAAHACTGYIMHVFTFCLITTQVVELSKLVFWNYVAQELSENATVTVILLLGFHHQWHRIMVCTDRYTYICIHDRELNPSKKLDTQHISAVLLQLDPPNSSRHALGSALPWWDWLIWQLCPCCTLLL